MVDEIPLSRPDITDLEVEAVTSALRSGRLSIGPMSETLETLVASRTDRRFGVSCSSGTAALHMALIAMGVGPGDEVITTPFSFVASANAALYVGATPVFVDLCPKSLNMEPELVKGAITRRTRAIIAVEAFGNPQYMHEYRAIADRHDLAMLEDSCEGLGGRLGATPIGKFGHAGVFGFYPNKQITTGEGGMVVTDDERLAEVCRSLRNQGRPARTMGGASGSWLVHERMGFNYRLSEIQAALGVAQMKRLDSLILARQATAQKYVERLLDHEHLILPTVSPEVFMSWFVFVVRLSDRFTSEERDRMIDGMRRHDVGAAPYFPCIHLQPYFRERFGYREGAFPIAERVSGRTIALPFFSGLSDRDADFVVQTLDLMIARESIRRT
ncbi:MAG TPA: polysaccharide biosynthesis protein [Phycisphaerales bacterium]|nr:polysaccharide biosynthesis protein [Phycisphaerales bacterium]